MPVTNTPFDYQNLLVVFDDIVMAGRQRSVLLAKVCMSFFN
jgi:hypothetical protein